MFGHFGVVPPTPKAIDGDVWQPRADFAQGPVWVYIGLYYDPCV